MGEQEESIREWWDKAHLRNDAEWLTGSDGPSIWRALKVSSLIKPGTKILNIGVGLGQCTRGLAELGAKVSVLDISQTAIDRVKDVIEEGFLSQDLGHLPESTYDVVISHLVTQHILDQELESQIHHVMRSLKPSGLFAMQFAFLWMQNQPTMNNTPEEAKVGGVCRTLRRMAELAESGDGSITWAQVLGSWPEYRSGWFGVHIVKKSSYTFSYAAFDASAGFSKWGAGNEDVVGALRLQIEGLEKDLAEVAKDREFQVRTADQISRTADQLSRTLEQLSSHVESLVKDRLGVEKDLAGVVKDRELQLRKVDELSRQLNETVRERDLKLRRLNEAVSEAVRERDLHLRNSEQVSHHLRTVLNSKAWRITWPLRAARQLFR
jgi:SAM-dependent methyltransferase